MATPIKANGQEAETQLEPAGIIFKGLLLLIYSHQPNSISSRLYFLQSSAIGWGPRAGWETFQIQAEMRLKSQGGVSSSILTLLLRSPLPLESQGPEILPPP